jgi:hypothetical protein
MTVTVAVTVDTDNDDVSTASERTALSWRSLQLVPSLAALFAELGLAATWFVRADSQLAEVYGRSDHLLATHAAWWNAFAARGDEVGWHPHVYRRDDDGRYEPETDEGAFVAKLVTTWNELCERGYCFTSVRVGEAHCTDTVMRAFAGFGLRVDATAIPGRVRDDADRRFDWGPTPNHPYRPSVADYRVPGEPPYRNLIEVPLTTMGFRARYDRRPMLRYVNPAYHADIFREGIDRHLDGIRRSASNAVLTMVIHPDEAREHPAQHGLYAHTFDTVRSNLTYLIDAIARSGLTMRTATVRDVAAAFALEVHR